MGNWSSSSRRIRQIAEHLASIAGPAKRYNLALLVVVSEELTENDIPAVSRFEEDPSYFARFVIAVDKDNPTTSLRNRISFLLLDWINSGTGQVSRLQSAPEEISRLVTKVAAELGIPSTEHLQKELLHPRADINRLAAALMKDLKREQMK